MKIKLLDWTSSRFHGLWILKIRSGLWGLPEFDCFFFFKANVFFSFLEFFFVIFYGLHSMELVLSLWPESSISKVNVGWLLFFIFFLKIDLFQFHCSTFDVLKISLHAFLFFLFSLLGYLGFVLMIVGLIV